MDVYTMGGLDRAYVESAAEDVMNRIKGADTLSVAVVVIERPEDCADVLTEFTVNDVAAFKKNCENAVTSMSYRAEGQEIIVVKAGKPFLADNPAALRGLIAHELMHTIQRRNGLEAEIQETAQAYVQHAIDDLQEQGYTDEEVAGFIRTVFSTAIFALKDIYDNTELIEQGFAGELEQYYYHMLGVDEYCRAPSFYGEEAELQEVQEALAFELGLLPAWLPFEALGREEADKIRDRIMECYEQDIPAVAEHVHRIRELYHAEYEKKEVFMEAFFDQLLNNIYELLETKLGEQVTG